MELDSRSPKGRSKETETLKIGFVEHVSTVSKYLQYKNIEYELKLSVAPILRHQRQVNFDSRTRMSVFKGQ